MMKTTNHKLLLLQNSILKKKELAVRSVFFTNDFGMNPLSRAIYVRNFV